MRSTYLLFVPISLAAMSALAFSLSAATDWRSLRHAEPVIAAGQPPEILRPKLDPDAPVLLPTPAVLATAPAQRDTIEPARSAQAEAKLVDADQLLAEAPPAAGPDEPLADSAPQQEGTEAAPEREHARATQVAAVRIYECADERGSVFQDYPCGPKADKSEVLSDTWRQRS
ncbi:hypothetical protein [Chitiniphilus shinanonensis]|uniref:hypothetical protein n=1 Tax=Chitiniphilus shinanonensis TaxID=553088 RepID=UPI003066D32D